jgi:hypothetical protein
MHASLTIQEAGTQQEHKPEDARGSTTAHKQQQQMFTDQVTRHHHDTDRQAEYSELHSLVPAGALWRRCVGFFSLSSSCMQTYIPWLILQAKRWTVYEHENTHAWYLYYNRKVKLYLVHPIKRPPVRAPTIVHLENYTQKIISIKING